MDAANINRLAEADILVVGDALLDRFVSGEVDRVSREAPVPVLIEDSTVAHPGGACNVATNILSCDGAVTIVGLTGDDAGADQLLALCESFPRMTAAFVRDASRPTALKTRFLSGWQQLLCVNTESSEPASPEVSAQLVATARDALSGKGAMVLSDYGRGALDKSALGELIGAARAVGTPVIVDPRRDDPAAYSGATLVTPNLGEMERFSGIRADNDEAAVAACLHVLDRAELDAVLLTRGADGMTLVRRDAESEPLHVRAQTHQVFDVTGAGDTVVAVLTASIATGAPLEDAVRLANMAAGIVVAKQGTATIHPHELRTALGKARQRGVVSWEDATSVVSLWQSLGLSVSFTNGCFDLLHRGHLHSLELSAQHGDRLVVGINSDASTTRLKGPGRPVQDEQARGDILAALRFIDLVVVFDEETPEELIRTLKPDVILKGADYTNKHFPGKDFIEARGGKVVLLPLLDGYSTTGTIERIGDEGS